MSEDDFSLTRPAPMLVPPEVEPKTRGGKAYKRLKENAERLVGAAPAAALPAASKTKKRPLKSTAATRWRPNGSLLEVVKALAGLNWPLDEIAGEIGISLSLVLSTPEIVEAYNSTLKQKKTQWRPTPASLNEVFELAKTGLTEMAVAARMNVPRSEFRQRMADTPQLRDAFERGNGLYHADRIDEFNKLVDEESPALRHVGTPYIFLQKVGGMNDSGESKKEPIVVQHQHEHRLRSPKPVAVKDVASFAAIEMQRAKEESAKALAAHQSAIDVEVV